MSSIPSAKPLQTTRLVVQNADRAWSERFNLQNPAYAIDPNTHVLDVYGRNAHPYSLRQRQPNGMAGSPYYNVPQLLITENNVSRPWIDYTMTPAYQYDTMGTGRTMYNRAFPQGQFPVYRGMTYSNPSRQPVNRGPPLPPQPRVASGPAAMSLAPLFTQTYTG